MLDRHSRDTVSRKNVGVNVLVISTARESCFLYQEEERRENKLGLFYLSYKFP